MEKDDEVKGLGNSLDFGARMYDTRIGRFLSVDAMQKIACGWTPYRIGFNNPIRFVDATGNFEVPKELVDQYPKAALLLQNFEKIINRQQLPAELATALEGIDIYKLITPKMFNALKSYSTLNPDQLEVIFKNESGPAIIAQNLDNGNIIKDHPDALVDGYTYWQFVQIGEDCLTTKNVDAEVTGDERGTIGIDDNIMQELNNALGGLEGPGSGDIQDQNKRQKAYDRFLSTILHEVVHCGRMTNYQGNETPSMEFGIGFEVEAWGTEFYEQNIRTTPRN